MKVTESSSHTSHSLNEDALVKWPIENAIEMCFENHDTCMYRGQRNRKQVDF